MKGSGFSERRRTTPKARKRGAVSGQRSRHTALTIDIHAHFVTQEYLRIIELEGEASGVRLRSGPDGRLILISQVPVSPITAHYHALHLRLRTLTAPGVPLQPS